ncbi:MAG TPA: MarR family transcriptional regulator [Thermoguttaceae bacterium]|nr:MarR family transcriptional regulator [Thermoguttaceae bacterium]
MNLEDQVIVALRRITRAIDLHSRELMQQAGLTAPQLAALQAIAKLQPVTMGALARVIHLSQATLTGILNRLEARSLVSRARSTSDRRTVVVELTEQGRSVLESAPSLLQDRFRRELLKLQQWEQTQMLATLQRIASMMDAEEIDAAPVLAAGDARATSEDVSQFLDKVGASAGGDMLSPADSVSESAAPCGPPGNSEK